MTLTSTTTHMHVACCMLLLICMHVTVAAVVQATPELFSEKAAGFQCVQFADMLSDLKSL